MAASRDIADLGSAFSGSANLSIDAGTLFIDAVNNRVGIGNTSPSSALFVDGSMTTTSNQATVGTTLYSVSNGNFGVGNSAPAQKLHIQGTGFATGDFRAPIFYDSDNTSFYADPAGQSLLYRAIVGPYAGSTSSGGTVTLEVRNNGGTGDGNVAAIGFHCTGTYGVHMHLRADGYFGAGGWSASAWRWYVNMGNGDMTAAGNVTAYSDPRLKEDITKIDSPVDTVMRLNGVKFRWKESSVIGHPGKYDYGVLANEVQEVLPEIVRESCQDSPDGDKYKTVDYTKIVPLLIEAIKEQQKQIEELKESIKRLEV